MRLSPTLHRVGELCVATILTIPLVLAGCGGGGSKSNTSITSSVVQLSGTNGDMSKYLGSWVSGCGYTYNYTYNPPNPIPTGISSTNGVINRFDFTTISGVGVQGTLTRKVFLGDQYCGAVPNQTVSMIDLRYTSAVTGISVPSYFIGSADKVGLGALSASGVVSGVTAYDFGFHPGFVKFQLKGVSSKFSITDLVYTKQ